MDGQGGGGWLPLDLSLATAGDLSLATAGPSASASAGERRPRPRPNRRTVSSLYAELGAMLPNLPTDRVSPCPALPCPRRPCFLVGYAGADAGRVVPQDDFFVHI